MTFRESAALVALAAIAAYAAAAGTTWQYDDFRVVVLERDVHSWTAWWAAMPGLRPLTKASYVANWTLSQAPMGFALAGVALHLAAALVVLALARAWLPAMAPGIARPDFAALACALVYALHPAQTEAAVYIAARSTTLSTLLTLLGLLAWERARAGNPVAWRAATVACLALSLAAREAAWTLPFLLVLVELARGDSFASALRRTAPAWIALALAATAVIAVGANRTLVRQSLAIRDPIDNLVSQVDAVVYLVAHPFATLRLNFDPDLPVRTVLDAAWLAKLAAAGALVAIGVVQIARRRWLGFAMLWFAVALAPTHGPLARYELANDRQLHLAMVGPALAVGVWLASWRRQTAAVAGLAALALLLGLATHARVGDYESEAKLWGATVRASPGNARAWNNLGYALEQDGDAAGARAAYERALALDPTHRKARGNVDALPLR